MRPALCRRCPGRYWAAFVRSPVENRFAAPLRARDYCQYCLSPRIYPPRFRVGNILAATSDSPSFNGVIVQRKGMGSGAIYGMHLVTFGVTSRARRSPFAVWIFAMRTNDQRFAVNDLNPSVVVMQFYQCLFYNIQQPLNFRRPDFFWPIVVCKAIFPLARYLQANYSDSARPDVGRS